MAYRITIKIDISLIISSINYQMRKYILVKPARIEIYKSNHENAETSYDIIWHICSQWRQIYHLKYFPLIIKWGKYIQAKPARIERLKILYIKVLRRAGRWILFDRWLRVETNYLYKHVYKGTQTFINCWVSIMVLYDYWQFWLKMNAYIA